MPDRLDVADALAERRFPTRIPLPERLARYDWRLVPTRRIPNGTRHQRVYAF